MRQASGSYLSKPASAAARWARPRRAPGIDGHRIPVSGSKGSYRYPDRSDTQPTRPQLVIATDIVYPPGVMRCRNGAVLATRSTSSMSACASASANPRNNSAPSSSGSRDGSLKREIMCFCATFPSLSRRGGCASIKRSRSSAAQTGWLVISNKNKVATRPFTNHPGRCAAAPPLKGEEWAATTPELIAISDNSSIRTPPCYDYCCTSVSKSTTSDTCPHLVQTFALTKRSP